MAKLNDITISKNEYRPCYVGDKKALFHRWVEHEYNPLSFQINSGMKYTRALIEFENGEVNEVSPSSIKFCDGKLYLYSFREVGEK